MIGLAFLVVLVAGAVGLVVYRQRGPAVTDGADSAKNEVRITQKLGTTLKISGQLAESYGIETTPAEAVSWRPQLIVDGRVLPNPNATLEVRAPFAGVLLPDAASPSFRIGAPVEAHQELARFEARFSPLEKIDLNAKSVEAEARYKGADDVLKIREERLGRLEKITSGSISRADLDVATIQVSEAKMQKDIAQTQWDIWKQTLERVGKKTIVVPIRAPIAGEIADIGAQPGANMEAGALLVRIVDFRRVLVRLDFPLSSTGALPPADVEIETLAPVVETSHRWRAHLRGPAANVEIGLQKSSYLYEIVPDGKVSTASWRPGLFVKAILPDPDKTTEQAIAIPTSALLMHQGRTLVYIQLGPGRFERREVALLGRDADRFYIAGRALEEGDLVVSRHPQVLLSEEFRIAGDDD